MLHGASTFLQAYVPPVYMPDDDADYDAMSSVPGSSMDSEEDSDSDLELPPPLYESEDYRELQALRELRQIKLASNSVEHVGYKVWYVTIHR